MRVWQVTYLRDMNINLHLKSDIAHLVSQELSLMACKWQRALDRGKPDVKIVTMTKGLIDGPDCLSLPPPQVSD